MLCRNTRQGETSLDSAQLQAHVDVQGPKRVGNDLKGRGLKATHLMWDSRVGNFEFR